MIKVIVFDFDGVLVDSNRLKDEAFFEIFKDNPQISTELIRDTLTRNVGTRFDILRDIFARVGAPQEDIETLVADYGARYESVVLDGFTGLRVAPDTEGMLRALSAHRCLYINSATPPDTLRASVKRLGIQEYFKDVFGMPPIKEENLRAILAREGIAPEEAVVIGDGEGDWRSAQACGTHFIAVDSGFHDWRGYDGFSVISAISEAQALISKI